MDPKAQVLTLSGMQTGLLEIVCMILGALGPAYLLLVFPGILGRYLWRSRQSNASEWPSTQDLDSDHTAHLVGPCQHKMMSHTMHCIVDYLLVQ